MLFICCYYIIIAPFFGAFSTLPPHNLRNPNLFFAFRLPNSKHFLFPILISQRFLTIFLVTNSSPRNETHD